ncbi:DUF2806 domain-containing protein [Acinetobacter sp. ANC 4779]|uniref:DUF2806 domain-containing protein n=1 Tax=Acinetobacter sp. ANC 4779 TaxID=2529848 RepID=UPI00103D43DE|nr:DUF2806 domain-containing protein [Acinetobacter sp. ANC 4779]TCB49013.1 DUF2806 domain-containing protein [Acinetobacter sp. ANC 4779]
MNMEQEIIKAATGIATTAVNKGVGKLTDLLFSKKILQQKRLETLSTTQDQKDAELIQQGLAEFRDERFILIEEQIGNPTSPLGLILAQNNQNQSENLGKCLSKAYEHLSEKADEEISDEQISETFFNKWMNYGKEVSEDELQDLWGRILAEETTFPNSVNYLVLNTLSMMSKNHLEAFNDLIPFICDRNLYCNNTLLAEENYSHVPPSILYELIDLNIIKGLHPEDIFFKKELLKVTYDDESFPAIYINKTNFIVLRPNENVKKIQPNFFLLTTVGQKLFEIAMSNYEIDDYFGKLINNFKLFPEFKLIEAFELVSLIDNEWQSKLIIQR